MGNAAEGGDVNEALLDGARYGELEEVMAALRDGADVNHKDEWGGKTALHAAAANGSEDVCLALLQAGANVNAQNESGNTPLHWACLNGHVGVVRLLMAKGGNPTVCNSADRTPVDEALSGGHDAIVQEIGEAMKDAEALPGVEANVEVTMEEEGRDVGDGQDDEQGAADAGADPAAAS
ncbi:unnamed protein product [Pedinophyceae sp. YPF-701]|nr:unnamed protein product [Pedinophyceae sp. YPF-701]